MGHIPRCGHAGSLGNPMFTVLRSHQALFFYSTNPLVALHCFQPFSGLPSCQNKPLPGACGALPDLTLTIPLMSFPTSLCFDPLPLWSHRVFCVRRAEPAPAPLALHLLFPLALSMLGTFPFLGFSSNVPQRSFVSAVDPCVPGPGSRPAAHPVSVFRV